MTIGQRTFLYLLLLGAIMGYLILSSVPPLTLLLVFLILLAIPLILTVLIAVLASATSGTQPTRSAGQTVPVVNKTLMRLKAFFPFDFFPDSLIVNEEDIIVVKKEFFFTGWTETIPVSDIKRVILSKGPFFSSLTIEQKSKEHITIGYLKREDAFAAKELVDGLIRKEEGRVEIPKETPLPVKKEIIRQAGKNPDEEKEALEKPL